LYEGVMPASQMRLQVDSLTARRIAVELGQRLGRPFPADSSVYLESRLAEYREHMLTAVIEGVRPGASIEWPDAPVLWRIRFRRGSDISAASNGHTDRFVILDVRGTPREFRFEDNSFVPGRDLPTETQRREVAQNAAQTVCGAISPDYVVQESTAGDRGALYTALWHPRRLNSHLPTIEATLIADRVQHVDCGVVTGGDLPMEPLLLPFELARILLRGCAAVVLAVLFLYHRMYNWALIWKRLPLAVAAAFMASWVTWDDSLRALSMAPGSLAAVGVLLLTVVIWIPVLWVAIAVAEQMAARWMRSSLASYVSLWSGQWRGRLAALSVLRGTAVGLAMAGVSVLIFPAARTAFGFVRGGGRLPFKAIMLVLLPCFPDPVGITAALVSPAPAAFVIAAVFGSAVVIGLAAVGICLGIRERKRQTNAKPAQRIDVVGAAGVGVMAVGGDLLHAAGYLLRPMAAMIGPLLVAIVLCWTVKKYDLLAGMTAIGTLALWNLNYPLLLMRSEVGNGAHWAIFVAWAVMVAAAAAIVLLRREEPAC
jgi:hypothetical protein